MMTRGRLHILVLALFLWLSFSGFSLKVLAEPVVSLAPSSGPPGSGVKISGSGFGDSPCGVNLFFDSLEGPLLGFAPIKDGRFSAGITIPNDATPGEHFIIAQGLLPAVEFCDGPSGEVASAVFTVTPAAQPLDFNIYLKGRVITPDCSIDAAFLEAIQSSSRPTTHGIVQLQRLPRMTEGDFNDGASVAPGDIAMLEALGVLLLEYLNGVSGLGTAYLASISRDVQADDPHFGELIRCLLPLEPADKIEPGLLPGPPDDGFPAILGIEVLVLFFDDVSEQEAMDVFAAHGLIADLHAPPDLWETIASPEQIQALADEDSVQWVEAGPLPFLPTVDDVRAASNVDPVQDLNTGTGVYGGLTGTGVQIGIMDSGVDQHHNDFAGRVIRIQHGGGDHGTHVAGIAGGSGVQSNQTDDAAMANGGTAFQWRGMAPQAEIAAYGGAGGNAGIFSDAINTFGVDVSNHSYVLQVQSLYNAAVASVDSIVAGNSPGIPARPVVWAAANNANTPSTRDCDGDTVPETPGFPQYPGGCPTAFQAGYFSILSPCKNCIDVGSVNNSQIHTNFSSIGPTMDGRLKPDVSAIGRGVKSVGADTDRKGDPATGNGYRTKSGTSMAAPAVAGMVALLLDQYSQTFGVNLDIAPPLPSTVKAILIQTAIDLAGTDPTINFDTGAPLAYGAGPDWATGYGLVDAEAAVQLIQNQGFVEDAVSTSDVTDQFVVGVGPGQTEMRVTLAWDDLAGAANGNETASKLVNDLDLTVIEPDGTPHNPLILPLVTPNDCDGNPANGVQVGTCFGLDPAAQNYFGPAAEGVDRRNNVEQVVVQDPAGLTSGLWTARVSVLQPDGVTTRLPMGGSQNYSLTARLNQPVCDANGIYVAECAGATTSVTLDGTGSFDPNGDPLSFNWSGPFVGGTTSGPTPTVEFSGVGTFEVTLEVDDGALTDECVAEVMVVDTTPPTLSVSISPDTLWPPNHRLVPVTATVVVTDICDPAPTFVLESITSDEPDNANGVGDGNTIMDIQEAAFGTPDLEFLLRAERAGTGDGRVYEITYKATDASGNETSATPGTLVPHDQNGVVEPLLMTLHENEMGTVLEWPMVPEALYYNVVRGDLGSLQERDAIIDLGAVSCVAARTPYARAVENNSGELPVSGDAFFYLVEYVDEQASSYGTASASKPRAPSSGACQ